MAKKKNKAYEIPEDKNIIQKDISALLQNQMLDYSAAVNLDRAIQFANDGMKPSQRAVIYTMFFNGLTSNGRHMKTARVVGNTMAFHPHGDSGILAALRGLADEDKVRLPLVDMQGDLMAAPRYTEVRPSQAMDLLTEGLKQDAVDMIPNFDSSETQPLELPAALPIGIINGGSGIGYGMASTILPHNPEEVMKAAIKLVDNPDMTDKVFARIVKGPDFPSGGIIVGIDGAVKEASDAHVSYKVRAKSEIEEYDGHPVIYITEVPYGTRMDTVYENGKKKIGLIEELANISADNPSLSISSIGNESLNGELKIAIHFDKGTDEDTVMIAKSLFYKDARNMVQSFGTNNNVIINNRSVDVGVKFYIKQWLEFRRKTLKRIDHFELDKIAKRLNIVDGLVRMADMIDDIIKVIKQSKGRKGSVDALMNEFKFNQEQAEYIAGMSLYRINAEDVASYVNEKEELESRQSIINDRLSNEDKYSEWLKEDLKNTLNRIKKFDWVKTERLTQVISEDEVDDVEVDKKKLRSSSVPERPAFVFVLKEGIMHRMTPRVHENQLEKAKETLNIVADLEAKTNQWIMGFTNDGGVITRMVNNLEDGNPNAGTYEDFHITVTDFKSDQTFVGGMIFTEGADDQIVSLTEMGLAKVNDAQNSFPNVNTNRYIKRMTPYNGLKRRDEGDQVGFVHGFTKQEVEEKTLVVELNDQDDIKIKLSDISHQSGGGSGSQRVPGFKRERVKGFHLED